MAYSDKKQPFLDGKILELKIGIGPIVNKKLY